MTLKENALKKLKAFSLAVLGLGCFIFVEYTVLVFFVFFKIDYRIYEGTFNLIVAILTILMMLFFNKLFSSKDDPLFRTDKLRADQTVALIVIGLGMLGLVTVYIIVADKIAEYIESLKKAVEQYRESVDRYADTPQIIVPVWDSVLYVITLCFVVPFSEEMVFRGAVFGHLRKGFGPWVSVILTALIFGFMHGRGVHIGYAVACGLIITACYYITDSLAAPVILHMVFNTLGSGVASFMGIEYFGITDDIRLPVMQVINIASCILMPVAAMSYAYLVAVKRMKEADARNSIITVEARKDIPAETDEPIAEDISLSDGSGIGAQQ